MSERLERISRLVGRGFLLKDDGLGIQELNDVTIEEFEHSGGDTTTPSLKKRVRVLFAPGFYDMVSEEEEKSKVFSIAAIGRLSDGTLRRADVSDVLLKSHSQGEGSRVIYTDPPR
jgi:hypothetical protein